MPLLRGGISRSKHYLGSAGTTTTTSPTPEPQGSLPCGNTICSKVPSTTKTSHRSRHTSVTESVENFPEVIKGVNPSDLRQKPGIGCISTSFMGKRRVVGTRLQSCLLEHVSNTISIEISLNIIISTVWDSLPCFSNNNGNGNICFVGMQSLRWSELLVISSPRPFFILWTNLIQNY